MLKTQKSHIIFTIFLTTFTLQTNCVVNNVGHDLINFVAGMASDFYRKRKIRQRNCASFYIQNAEEKIYEDLKLLCKQYPLIGQFSVLFDRQSACPTICHNIRLADELSYSESPGRVIYISYVLTEETVADSLEEGLIVYELARCALGQNNRFSSFILNLLRRKEQRAFEAETLTVFYLLKEKKLGTLEKYISQRENVAHKIGQINGIAAFRKEFPNCPIGNKIIESIVKDASTQKLIKNFQFTNSYKKAKKQVETSFRN